MAAVAGDSPEVNLRCEKQNIRIPQLDMELRELQTEPETDTEIRDKVTKDESPNLYLGHPSSKILRSIFDACITEGFTALGTCATLAAMLFASFVA